MEPERAQYECRCGGCGARFFSESKHRILCQKCKPWTLVQRRDEEPIPAVELTQWRAGRVLSKEDEDILMRYLREVDEDMDLYIDAGMESRKQVLLELGGQQLVDAFESDDLDNMNKALQGALKTYYDRRAAKNKASN